MLNLLDYNNSVNSRTAFDPTILDGKSTEGLEIKKSNWAQKIDKGPFRAYPVTGGITFTYGGLKVDENGSVLDNKNNRIKGLFACGEVAGGLHGANRTGEVFKGDFSGDIVREVF